MWPSTRVSRVLGIAYPILQGPFGGGNSTAALAAAVSNAGGLGAFGAVALRPEEIERLVIDIRERTPRPFAVNLWVPIAGQDDVDVPASEIQRAASHLLPYLSEYGIASAPRERGPLFEQQIEALLRASPPVFSFVMGIPDRAILDEIRRRGAKSIGTATTVDEAVALEEAGFDIVVASGSDAGGHRGSFLAAVERSLIGTMSLVPQIADAVDVPVVAAGGIVDGRGIAAALALGAEGVQIGTAFLATNESGAPLVHKSLLGTPSARTTRLTRAFTGRHARGIENALMLELEDHPDGLLPYPAQSEVTLPLRRAAARAGRAEHMALWAGQAGALARPIGAADLVSLLVDETTRSFSRAGHEVPRRNTMPTETQALADVIQLYFDGLYEGDTSKLARAFHPNARLYSLSEGALQEVKRDDWLAVVAGRTAPKVSGLTRTDRIVSIDVTEEVLATAKVECSIHPKYFVDHLTFLKTATTGWQIVAKAFRTLVKPVV
jgi:nitronate monooxygenase